MQRYPAAACFLPMMHTLADLDWANRHVAEANARIEHQQDLMARLAALGGDTQEAGHLLALLTSIREEMLRHRDIIAATVVRQPSPL
jgi:hypothetical protein